MKYIISILITTLAIGVAAENVQFEWPVIRGQFPELRGITSTFGESRGDHFHNGVDISGIGDAVHSMAKGEILFSKTDSDDPFAPPVGPGNFVLVDHGGGWWSGYFHLGKLAKVRSGAVDHETVIGYSGNTGHSVGAHLHFFVSKDFGRTLVNPLVVLPGSVDKNPPEIGPITVVTPTAKTNIQQDKPARIRLSQPFPIYVTVTDPGLESNTNRGIYELRWKLNDTPEEVRTFQKMTVVDGEWRLDGKPFFDVFGQGQYLLGRLNFRSGMNTVKVTATDQAGNQSQAEYQIDVQRMY